MADLARARVTEANRRHFDFVQILQRISESLTKKETKLLKLYCLCEIPKGRAEKLKDAVDVFQKLIELDKIDEENLEFIREILERMGREDLVRTVLTPFQPPGREIPENPELQPGTSTDDARADSETSDAYLVIHGQRQMIQETVDQQRHNLASICGTRGSQVKFRGYKKGKSILVHFSVPRENTAVLRHMADHSDPRLVYMGVKSLQIDAELPINVKDGTLLFDFKRQLQPDVRRQLPVDDIEVGCSPRRKRQRAPVRWTRLSALNLFSDALPLHLQAAASLEYQGFSYSLVRALAQKDQLREHQMRRAIQNLRNAEVDSNKLRQKAEVDSNKLRQKAEGDSNTIMTLRSKLKITENMLKEANTNITVLEEKLQQAQEYAEKAAKQVATHMMEYRGEKPPGGWLAHVEKADTDGTTRILGDEGDKLGEESAANEEDRKTAVQEDVLVTEAIEQELHTAGAEGAASRAAGDFQQGVMTFGGKGSEPGKFQYPRGVVVSPSNEIFVADYHNRRVQVHSTEGVYLRHFPTVVPGTGEGEMVPHDICMDANGTLWVVGWTKRVGHVVQYGTDGTVLTQFDLPRSNHSRGIAADMRTNHILVTEAVDYRGEVQVFRPDGSLVRTVRHPGGGMRSPEFVTVDGEGNILVSDWRSESVYVYDESGKFLFKFEKEPSGICTDSLGHIIVADSGNERVQIFTRHGEFVRTSVRTGSVIYGLAVGPEGQLVMTSWNDHTVTVFPNY